jgi:hypothetical protein
MASVIETFLLIFQADASSVKKGTKEAKKSTEDLIKSLGTAEVVSLKLGNSFKNLVGEYGGILAGLFSAAALIDGAAHAIEYADTLGKLSKQLNLNVEDLSVWDHAVKATGGTGEAFRGSIESLSDTLSQFSNKFGSDAALTLRSLGINMMDASGHARKALDILPEIAERFSHLDNQRSFQLGKRIGLDPGTIRLLQKGGDEVEKILKRQRELGVVTKEDAARAEAFNEKWQNTVHIFQDLSMSLGMSVLPAINKLFDGIEKVVDFFKAHADFIKGTFIGIGSAIAYYVVPPLISAGIAALVLYAPIIALGAGIAALGVAFGFAYDDMMTFKRGGDSVIGDLIKKNPELKETIDDLSEAYKQLGEASGPVLKFMWDGTKGVLSLILLLVRGIIKLQSVFGIFGGLGALKSSKVVGELVSTNKMSVADDIIKKSSESLSAMNQSPLNNVTSATINPSGPPKISNNTVKIGDIIVNAKSGEPEKIAQEVWKKLQGQFNFAQNHFDDGIKA